MLNQPEYEPERSTPLPHTGFDRVQQLTIYIKETDRVEGRLLYLKILELVKAHGGAGATALKGVAGYSISSRSIMTAGFADLHQRLPLVILIVDTTSKIREMLPQLNAWVAINGGLLTIENLEAHHLLHPGMEAR